MVLLTKMDFKVGISLDELKVYRIESFNLTINTYEDFALAAANNCVL